MAGKKAAGENSKKASGNSKKAEAAARKAAEEEKNLAAKEDLEWSKGVKSNAKKYAFNYKKFKKDNYQTDQTYVEKLRLPRKLNKRVRRPRRTPFLLKRRKMPELHLKIQK